MCELEAGWRRRRRSGGGRGVGRNMGKEGGA